MISRKFQVARWHIGLATSSLKHFSVSPLAQWPNLRQVCQLETTRDFNGIGMKLTGGFKSEVQRLLMN